ncbi:ABC transporter related protein [Rhodomicrobium vannielii ATCC 17100]|uniref:ABC transporter related protein n=1 Tax=Rhodomicrobium vannielii (strain ATCC 17100 / DSM 162 / LMG 4299 / NCIMB 10020 / ATH 3.1.1) TaxID=648757 RepID=E3I049_RHOVT|nr:ABC transporter ATP-binding protein [Rhodomicrobium vannielii]ADP71084.1 ABC transporter related protein [Rhodomicrobium vannielii ATCC 17100]
MSETPLLEARGLNTYYGASHVLRSVDFHVGRGETVSLLGRNGMGKTTLMRSLMGLVVPKSGDIRFAGVEMRGWRPSAIARAGVGFVPEGRGIFPNLTVEENLVFAEREGADGRRDWTREAVIDLFPRLAERRTNWGNQLSGGEQQMLTIGRALMSNPSLLLVDEATEGLAPLVRDDIWRTLRLIADRGVAIVVVDKNLDDVVKLCRRHIILVKGQIVFEGDTHALAANDDFVRSQLGL